MIVNDTITVDGKQYPVVIHYEERRNCTVSIGKKTINIRIAAHIDKQQQQEILEKMKKWAERKLREKPALRDPAPPKEYRDGDILKIGDEEFTLSIRYSEKRGSSARITGNRIELNISSELPGQIQRKHISSLLSRCVGAKRLPDLWRRINELNVKHFGQKVNRIFFKHQKTRWGSCSKAGNINISTRLLFAPEDVLEYVCIHELAHLIEHNHSDRFWALVENAMPDYRDKINWLKKHGHECVY